MRAIKIGFIDIQDTNIISLMQQIALDYRFKLCGIVQDTREGLEFVKEEAPDVLFLRYEMPSGESVDLLEEIAALDSEIRPYIIVTSNISNSVLISYLISVGACDFVRRPYAISSMLERLSYLYAYINNNQAGYKICEYEEAFDERFRVREADVLLPKRKHMNILTGVSYDLLIHSGIPFKAQGFTYLMDCIKILYLENKSMLFSAQALYAEVAGIHVKKPAAIERSIRNAIKGGWENKKHDKTDKYMNLFDRYNAKPSNKEFIIYATRYVKKIIDDDIFSW